LGERRRVAHGEVREQLPVDLDVGPLEARDQRAVGQAVDASRRVDARDPQAAEVALAGAAVLVGELPRALHGLQRGLEEFAPSAVVALRGLENLAATGAARDDGLCAWHRSISIRSAPSGAAAAGAR